jgi:carbonic anhydrase
VPNLVTQTEPGELFVVRNAGNIIPAAPEGGGEVASIEFAVKSLKIRDIIICGHSDCGAMKGVLNPATLGNQLPHLKSWLSHAQRTGEIMKTQYRHLSGQPLVTATVGENVLVQVENLKTHAFIQEAIDQQDLAIHGWVYKFETGEVFNYDTTDGQYHPLTLERGLCPIYPMRTDHGDRAHNSNLLSQAPAIQAKTTAQITRAVP